MYVASPAETGKALSLELIANHLYGPSYVSREYALRYWDTGDLSPRVTHQCAAPNRIFCCARMCDTWGQVHVPPLV